MFHVDLDAVRAAFDEQVRRDPAPGPDARVDRDELVTRAVGLDGTWAAVLWSDLSEENADDVIRAELAAADADHFEWKHYAGDRPPDLPGRLAAAGLEADAAETVLVADLADVELPEPPLDGVRLVTVDDEQGVDAMVRVHLEVFGDVHPGTASAVRASLSRSPRPVDAVVAYAADRPVSAGRVEFAEGRDFAGIFGGGTAADWRGRGVFRALVARRAALARERGVRYLYVDAVPMSRPILERLGFVPLTVTTPWIRTRTDG